MELNSSLALLVSEEAFLKISGNKVYPLWYEYLLLCSYCIPRYLLHSNLCSVISPLVEIRRLRFEERRAQGWLMLELLGLLATELQFPLLWMPLLGPPLRTLWALVPPHHCIFSPHTSLISSGQRCTEDISVPSHSDPAGLGAVLMSALQWGWPRSLMQQLCSFSLPSTCCPSSAQIIQRGAKAVLCLWLAYTEIAD